MRPFRTPTAFVAAVTGLALASTVALAAIIAPDLTGTWDFSVVTENGTGTPTVTLKQAGEKLTGTYESRMLGVRALEGTVKGDSVKFALATSGESNVVLTFYGLIVDANNLRGTVDFGGMGGASFTAMRQVKP